MSTLLARTNGSDPLARESQLCHPTGVITFLFTDLVDSTRLWEYFFHEMAQAFQQHEQLIRTVCASLGGYVYKMVGDAFQIAFSNPAAALQAALTVQRQSTMMQYGRLGQLRVRMALHIGCTEERADDYVGPVLNRIGRLVAAASGGQILLSQEVALQLRPRLSSTVLLVDLGLHTIKDLRGVERIFQIVVADLPQVFPCLNPALAQPVALAARTMERCYEVAA